MKEGIKNKLFESTGLRAYSSNKLQIINMDDQTDKMNARLLEREKNTPGAGSGWSRDDW